MNITITLTAKQAGVLHNTLTHVKNVETRGGQVWTGHQDNAQLRTLIQNALADAREEQE